MGRLACQSGRWASSVGSGNASCLAYHGYNLADSINLASDFFPKLDVVPDGGFAVAMKSNNSNTSYWHRFKLTAPYTYYGQSDTFNFMKCSDGALLSAGTIKYKSTPNTGWAGGVIVSNFMSCSAILSISGELPQPYCQ